VNVAEAAVEYMNIELRVYNGTCATLRLKDVLNAGMTTQTAPLTADQHIFYALTFRTTPGDGVFQAAVEWIAEDVRIDRDMILRLNAYRPHSGCIEHIVYKKWCYCVGTR